MADRYATVQLFEDQYEPGSNGAVLRNLAGISDPQEMSIAETAELWRVQESLIAEISDDQTFRAQEVCIFHQRWLQNLYPWAGQYRQVNIGKGGFQFAMAHAIPALMEEFERKQLQRYTPCRFADHGEVARALAEVHVELMLIHPFREGNGRLGRLLATIMALQAGLPLLDFSALEGQQREVYFAAIRRGLDRDYALMADLFTTIIRESLFAVQSL
jgi:cell filamentation protein